MANLSNLLVGQSNLVTDQDLAAVATTGSYTDLTNKPTIPTGSYTDLTNKPTLAAVATSGSYTDLTNKPVVISLKGTSVTYPGDDLAADIAGSQTITITGTGFESTPTVYIDGTIAPSVTFVSSTQITVTTPAKAAGTYDIYIVNPGGATAIMVFGISYSGTPSWTTAAGSLGSVDANFTAQLQATGDAPVTYALTSGSVLPSGVTLSSSGLITGSGLSTEQTFNFSVTATDAQNQDTPRSFSVTVSLGDVYFKYVTLLLSGDPIAPLFTADASTNGLNIYISGDVRASTLTPFTAPSGTTTYGSGYFDGSGDYLSTPSTSSLSFGSGDFTIEAWVYANALGSYNAVFAQWPDNGGTANNSYVLEAVGSDMVFYYVSGGTSLNGPATLGTITTGSWIHYAICRSGNTLYPFKNGVLGTTIPITESLNTSASNVTIGGQVAGAGYWNGYISNVRAIKGTALYTSSFVVPTTPLTAVTNTSLLTLQNNGSSNNNLFKDSSTNNFTITRNGNTTQGSFSPYGANWSNFFNGSSNLSLATATALGTGNVTVEFWFYPTDVSATYYGLYDGRSVATTNTGFGVFQYGQTIEIYGNGLKVSSAASAFTANTWTHFAVVRTSGTCQIYINGVASGSSGSYSDNLTSTTRTIGSNVSSANAYIGYISNLREVTSALYSGTFTPSTTPLTAISGTTLLTCADNRFIDDSANNYAITFSIAFPSVERFNPFGASSAYSTSVVGGSAYFDGTGDYLSVPTGTALNLSSGDFTIEGWIYATDVIGYHTIFSNGDYPSTAQVILSVAAAPSLYMSNGSGWVIVLSSSINVNINSWNHIAVTASGTTYTIWVNGVSGGSSSASFTRATPASTSVVGRLYVSTDDYYTKGYTSNVRVVKGTALYTSNFTPSTTPLTAVSNTSLLLSADSSAILDNAMMSNLETSGNARISTAVKKYGTGSMYFDGVSGTYLTTPNQSTFAFGTGNFTIEGWFNAPSGAYDPMTLIRSWTYDGTNFVGFRLEIRAASDGGKLGFYVQTTYILEGTYTPNTWVHFAIVKNGTTAVMYINGVATSAPATCNILGPVTGNAYIGLYSPPSGYMLTGYIDDLRVTKGIARYTANFTPPTSAHKTK